MRYLAMVFVSLLFFVGCSNTWHGVKEDTNNAYQWSKDKVHDGAEWVGEKTKQTLLNFREMAERSKAAVLKTVEVKASWGSNPYLPATF